MHGLIMEGDWEYLLKKVSKRVFDFDESVKYWKNHIIDWRRDDSCTKEQARAAFDVITDLDNDGIEDCNRCAYILNESTEISELGMDFWELLDGVRVYPPEAITFAKTIWPMLCSIIREEIKELEELKRYEKRDKV